MRALLLLTFLLSAATAAAQPAQGASEPEASSPDEPEWARTPSSPRPAEPLGEGPRRYSRFSAGPAGPSIAVAEVLIGLSGGAILGTAYDADGRTDNLYTGAMLGGLALGTAGIFYQYFVPVERRESVLATTASLAGLAGGIAFANNRNLGDRDRALLGIIGSQVGMFTPLVLTSGGKDISGADFGLISLTSFYATIFASTVEFINDAENPGGYNFAPMLMAPAIGMAVGGLLAIPLELNSLSFAILWPVPIGLGAMAFGLAAPLSNNATTGRVGLIGLSAGFVISAMTLAFTYTPPPQERLASDAPRIVPMPVLLAAGRDNRGLAAGPGLWVQF
jgi:hypothetical protein